MIEIKVLASGSTGNCYWISDGRTSLLIEAGIPINRIKRGLNYKLSEIEGCLISHEHQDHCKAVRDIIKVGIDCYMSQGTAEELKLDGHRVHIIQAKKQFQLGTWTILPFEVQHDAVEPLGFLLASRNGGKLVYATDTYYIRYKFSGLTHIMVECNYSLDILNENISKGLVPAVQKKRILQSHFNLENVKEFLKANDLSQVREIWLLHLSDRNSDAERFKREIMELTGKPVKIAGE